jgi:hypothetical protein
MTLRILGTLALAVALGVGVSAAQKAASPKTMSVTGIVTSVTPSSLAIEGKAKAPMTFVVDSSTKVLARGATKKTKEKKEAGAAGLAITDVVKSGNQVTIKYTKTGETMHATTVTVASR